MLCSHLTCCAVLPTQLKIREQLLDMVWADIRQAQVFLPGGSAASTPSPPSYARFAVGYEAVGERCDDWSEARCQERLMRGMADMRQQVGGGGGGLQV